MKTIRIFGMVFTAILLCVGFSSCGDDEDDENTPSVTASLEGTWYLKSEKWYGWKDGKPDMTNVTGEETYEDYSNTRIWTIKKNGDSYKSIQTKGTNDNTNIDEWEKKGTNEYQKGDDRLIIKSLTSSQLVVDYYDNYYTDEEEYKEYGIYTFMK